MEISKFQKEISKIFSEIAKKPDFKEQSKEDILIRIMEEVGEVSRQVIREKYRKDKFNKANLTEEISDVIMLLNFLASKYNIDLSKECEDKIRRMREKFDLGQD